MKLIRGVLWSATAALFRQLQSPNGNMGSGLFRKARSQDQLEFNSWSELERLDNLVSKHHEYQYNTEFQSHEPEFDYLRSVEIEEKINKVKWCARQMDRYLLFQQMIRPLNYGRSRKVNLSK